MRSRDGDVAVEALFGKTVVERECGSQFAIAHHFKTDAVNQAELAPIRSDERSQPDFMLAFRYPCHGHAGQYFFAKDPDRFHPDAALE